MKDTLRRFDPNAFWKDSEYALKSYTEALPTEELIASIQAELGVRLPAFYIALMKTRNGGIPRDRCFPTQVPTSWAEDHVAITGIMGIGRNKTYSLCGKRGSQFMKKEWGYPDIGICLCHCPSGGHDMIMLDYRESGRQGEPEVVHVDQERDYRITFLAKDFKTFIRGLVNESVFDTADDDLKADLDKIKNGSFSTLLSELIAHADEADFGSILRNVCQQLIEKKGYFALHGDPLSQLVYDLQFYLYTNSNAVRSKEDYFTRYPALIALGDGVFSTGGYAPDFVKNWMKNRLSNKQIIQTASGNLVFSNDFRQELLKRLKGYTSLGS